MKKKCIACHSTKISFYFKAGKTSYFRCGDCTHVCAFSVPKSTYENYDERNKYVKWQEYLYNIFERRVNDISQFVPKGKALEVGCSVGFMLDVLKRKGFLAEGLEPSLEGVKYSQGRGHTVHHGYLEKNKLKPASYDVVLLNHVFEHIPDLDKACQAIRKLLRKDGVVYIDNPNFGCLEAMFWKEKWRFLIPNEHYSQFNPRSIRTVLERNGFEILLLQTNSPIYDFASLPRELLRCVLHDQKRLVFYALEFPLATLEHVLHRGKGLEVIAKVHGESASKKRTTRRVRST